jgi:L-methionine (R)-S-oxide reductase
LAESIPHLGSLPRAKAYEQLQSLIDVILHGVDDPVAEMATVATMVHHAFGHLWTGFYRVVDAHTLRVGPYQGSLGCLEISFGKGVCGTAAAERRTVIVDDVSRFPGHITCDGRSRSEIVVPVFGPSGDLMAVFDIDSEHPASFSRPDELGLERIVSRFARSAARDGT